MYRHIRSPEPMSDEYIQPYSAKELIALIEKAIRYSSGNVNASNHGTVPESIPSKPVHSFFVTSGFEKGVKKLRKDHKTRELLALRDAVDILSKEGSLEGKHEEHYVSNAYREIKLGDSNVLLLYGIVPGTDIISVSIEFAPI